MKKLFFLLAFCFFTPFCSATPVYSVIKGKPATLKANSPGSSKFEWTFADGTKKHGPTITHTFTQLGQTEVTLTVSDATKTNVLKKTIYVRNSGNTTALLKLEIEGKTYSSGTVYSTVEEQKRISSVSLDEDGKTGNVNETWRLNNQIVSPETIPSLLNKPGTYQIRLTTSPKDVSSSRDETYITVIIKNTPPVIESLSLTASGTLGAKNAEASVSAEDPDGHITQYRFEILESGRTVFVQISQTPETFFNLAQYPGKHKYDLKVTVIDDAGNRAQKTKNNAITVDNVVQNNAPTAHIHASPGNLGDTDAVFSFFGEGTDPDGDMLKYEWNFSDGTKLYTKNATKKFTTSGKHTIKLIVSDGIDTDTDTLSINVNKPVKPEDDLNANIVQVSPASSGAVNRPFYFYLAPTGGNESKLKINWDMGDGSSYRTKNVGHKFTKPGKYKVEVTLSDGSDTETDSVTITVVEEDDTQYTPTKKENTPPSVQIQNILPGFGDTSTKFYFHPAILDVDNDMISVLWDFGDGSTSKLKNPWHQYKKPGTYNISITANDGSGDVKSETVQLEVGKTTKNAESNNPPSAAIQGVMPLSGGDTNTNFSFFMSAFDKDGDTLDIKWDFGDGTSSTLRNPTHKFEKKGSYTTTLSVSDGVDTVKKTMKVAVNKPTKSLPKENLPPVAEILNITPRAGGDTNSNYYFYVNASDPNQDKLSITWDFGDGVSSNLRNPGHKYEKAGTYTVTLTVSDGKAKVTQKTNVQVAKGTKNNVKNTAPIADIQGVTPSTGGNVETVFSFYLLAADAENDYLKIRWDMGDGTQMSIRNPGYRYKSPGRYTVKVSVSDGEFTTEDTIDVEVVEVGEKIPKNDDKNDLQKVQSFADNQNNLINKEDNLAPKKQSIEKLEIASPTNIVRDYDPFDNSLKNILQNDKLEKQRQLKTETDFEKRQNLQQEIKMLEDKINKIESDPFSLRSESFYGKVKELEIKEQELKDKFQKEKDPKKRKLIQEELNKTKKEIADLETIYKKVNQGNFSNNQGDENLIETQLMKILAEKKEQLKTETDPEKRKTLLQEINEIEEEIRKIKHNPFLDKNDKTKELLTEMLEKKQARWQKETDPEKKAQLKKEIEQMSQQILEIESNPDPDDFRFAFANITGNVNTKFFLYAHVKHHSQKALFFEWDFGNNLKRSGQNVTIRYSTPGLYSVKLSVSDGESSIEDELILKIE